MNEDASKKITFFSKSKIECPICDKRFLREDLLTGGGRMIAGDLTRDLRRLYEPSRKFGEIFPLIYTISVCPQCLYAAFPQDFAAPPEEAKKRLEADADHRRETLRPLFGELDFSESRTLKEGAASYFLAMMCYDFFEKDSSPTIKQAVSSLRAAWVFVDLHKRLPDDNYDLLALNFYRKARFFYAQAVEKEQNGAEGIGDMKNLGPDLDKNYGYDGVLYLSGLLEYLHGSTRNPQRRSAALARAKTSVAKIFGMGKASKNKPTVLLERAKELYTSIAKELEKLGVASDGMDEVIID
ncbi:MAG: DUF2225 domain-containing protein [Spirochaetales bacterium]|jgi:uncharacterized protein (DUF2225 family)|nr:DUF2225 domain-containing protein [Spirochaetales bacterium]